VVSSQIADIFRNNSLKNGLLPIVLAEDDVQALMQRPDDELTVDVAARELRTPDGRVYAFPLDAFAQTCLLQGVDELGYRPPASPTSNVTEPPMHADIVVLPGDGIGPEITAAAPWPSCPPLPSASATASPSRATSAASPSTVTASRCGIPLAAARPPTRCCWARSAAEVVPTPRCAGTGPAGDPQGAGPVRQPAPGAAPGRVGASPIKPELLQGVDIVVVRELTGGIYFGDKTRSATDASDLCRYSVAEIERVLRSAFKLAQAAARH
jgi:hypothetical protein